MAEKEAELSSLRAENERLEEEMESLRSQLDEARQNASLSAECGLKLMELNQDLEQRLEQTVHGADTGEWVAGLSSLVLNTTRPGRSMEYDHMREQLTAKHKMETERADQLHKRVMSQLV